MLAPAEKQTGFGVLGAILVVAIMSAVMLGYTQRAAQQHEDARVQATVASINQLASAQLNHYAAEGEIHFEKWAADIPTLVSRNFIPAFRNNNAVGNPYTFGFLPGGLTISTVMTDEREARRVAQGIGSNASVSGSTITASYPRPGTIPLLNQFVRRDGSNDVFGTITFRSGATLNLNGNDVANAGTINTQNVVASNRISVKNSGGTGLVESDISAVTALTVQSFQYVP